MGARNRNRLANRRGQSIVEYLVVAAAIIGVVVLLALPISTRVNTITADTVSKFDDADASINKNMGTNPATGDMNRF